jgi:DNA replication protein DnaD
LAPRDGGGWLQSDVTELRQFVNQWRVFQTLKGRDEQVDSDGSEIAYPCGSNITTTTTTTAIGRFTNSNDGSSNPTTHQSTINQVEKKEVKSGIQNATCSCVEKDYDVAVHQLAAAWLKTYTEGLDQIITHEQIDNTIQFTFKSFGVNTIILQTIPINNNIQFAEELLKTNQQIWNYVRTFRQQEFNSWMESKMNAESDAGVRPMRKILVMELGAFSISLNLHAAIQIGAVNESDSLASAAEDLLKIHSISPSKFNYGDSNFFNNTMVVFDKLIAQKLQKLRPFHQHQYILSNTCMNMLNETQRNNTSHCGNQNMFSSDGIHWCTDVTGPRLDAVVACLTKCSLIYNYDENGENGSLVDCERKCNEKFMTLSAIDWVDADSMSVQF